jgi:hypothetical protein
MKKKDHHCEGGNHPTRSPDLAPSNFHSFLHLKERLASQKFHEAEEVKNKVTMWLGAQVVEICDIIIQKNHIQAQLMP